MPVYDPIPWLMPVLVVANCEVARSVALSNIPGWSTPLLCLLALLLLLSLLCAPDTIAIHYSRFVARKNGLLGNAIKPLKCPHLSVTPLLFPVRFIRKLTIGLQHTILSAHCAPHKAQCIHFHFILAHSLYPLQSPASTSNRFSSILSSHSPLPIRLTLYKFAVKGIRR